ncbi:glycosyltransferase [Microbacteriaceae bacterium K1510]|nr:glycosyltransferase [Microbacteriaceae bacterium K1510]
MTVAVFARAGARAASAKAAPDAQADSNFPELDCIRHRVTPARLDAAEMRAERVGVGADSALIAAGTISEEDYARAFAAALDTDFEPLDEALRAQCPVDDARLIDSAAAGLLPLTAGDGLLLVLAPRGIAARRIVQIAAADPSWPKRFRFTTRERLVRFVLRSAGATLVARACNRLKDEMPLFSAAVPHRASRATALAVLALVAASATLAPAATALALSAALAILFLGWLGLRLMSTVDEPSRPPPLPLTADTDLPIYTIIAALYREARSVEGLMQAIARLDYPVEKLDVILAVEADDIATQDAIAGSRMRLPITVIPVPVAAPRTKPKALNAALPFARGAFTVIYDAEDRPEPDQLRRALRAFRSHGDELACVQARLSIDNTADSWLTRGIMAQTPQAV